VSGKGGDREVLRTWLKGKMRELLLYMRLKNEVVILDILFERKYMGIYRLPDDQFTYRVLEWIKSRKKVII
jgi:hypothetical protein